LIALSALLKTNQCALRKPYAGIWRLHMKAFTGSLKRSGKNCVRRCLKGIVLCLLVLGSLPRLHGQVAQQLLGRVTDTSGAVVANAVVTVTNEATGVVATTHTS